MLQIINFSMWHRLGIIFGALSLINVTIWFVLDDNQRNGLYPVDADSIGLPIMLTMAESLLAITFFGAICLLQHGINSGLRNWHKSIRVLGLIGVLSLYGLIGWFGVTGLGSWWIPHHYLISLSYFVLLVTICLDVAISVIKWKSNESKGATHT